jgi:hypothetical protein
MIDKPFGICLHTTNQNHLTRSDDSAKTQDPIYLERTFSLVGHYGHLLQGETWWYELGTPSFDFPFAETSVAGE